MTGSLAGRTALVTGGSSGIGLEIATVLAAAGADVFLPVRNREKGERAAQRIRETAARRPAAVPAREPDVQVLDLDLARSASVQGLVSRIVAEGIRIDLLVLNAGVVTVGQGRRTTEDGFELNFQTNFLGHAALTLGLLPQLRAAGGRVVVQCSVSTAGMHLPWRDLLGEQSYRGLRAYRSSKLALGLFGMELARRSRAEAWGVSVQLCHPGITPGSAIAPGIRALVPDPVVRWAERNLGNPPAQAALTALAAGTAPAAESPWRSDPATRTGGRVPRSGDRGLRSAGTGPRSAEPGSRMFVPSRWFSLAGPPRERAPFRSLQNRADAERLWYTTWQLLGEGTADGGATRTP